MNRKPIGVTPIGAPSQRRNRDRQSSSRIANENIRSPSQREYRDKQDTSRIANENYRSVIGDSRAPTKEVEPAQKPRLDHEKPIGSARRPAETLPLTWQPQQPPEPPPSVSSLILMPWDPEKCDEEVQAVEARRIDVIWDESRRCFASHWPGLLSETDADWAFATLRKHSPWEELTSKRGHVTRHTCWYVRGGCKCDYAYGSARVGPTSLEIGSTNQFSAVMEELLAKVCNSLCPWLPQEEWPNSANLNLYVDGEQSVGWHADDESLFQGRDSDCPIISISLGATREFWISVRDSEVAIDPRLDSIVEVDLSNGDVISMEGLCQKHCLHFVPTSWPGSSPHPGAIDGSAYSRINVTWRWIREHKPKCPLRSQAEKSASQKLFEHACAVPTTNANKATAHDWANGRPVSWRSCNSCHHDAWRRGRNCLQVRGKWLCRLCWQRDGTPTASAENERAVKDPFKEMPQQGDVSTSASSNGHRNAEPSNAPAVTSSQRASEQMRLKMEARRAVVEADTKPKTTEIGAEQTCDWKGKVEARSDAKGPKTAAPRQQRQQQTCYPTMKKSYDNTWAPKSYDQTWVPKGYDKTWAPTTQERQHPAGGYANDMLLTSTDNDDSVPWTSGHRSLAPIGSPTVRAHSYYM